MMSYLPKFQKYCIILTVWDWDVGQLTAIIHKATLVACSGGFYNVLKQCPGAAINYPHYALVLMGRTV